IGAQRIGSPIYLLKIPIRLLTVDGGFPSTDQHKLNGDSINENDDDNKSTASTNNSLTFDDESKDYGTPFDIALHRIEYLAGHRIPHNFNITSTFGKVAKFFIFKTVYRLGEDIIGLFDLTECSVKCIRYSVVLQSEETIAEQYFIQSSTSSSSPKSRINLLNHTRFNECCLNLNHSPMILPIPFTLTPTFSNDLISLKWNLHFSFVIENNQKQQQQQINLCTESEDGVQTLAPRQLPVQVMTWDFPIKIVATYPAHVAKGFQMASMGTLNI
ncbi:retrograde Golgi transport protein RGP-like protein, partial [Euroglyphus maynei]